MDNDFVNEDFESEDFSEEEFRQKVINAARVDLDQTPNISDTLEAKKAELANTKANFEAIWAAYKTLSKARNKEEWQFIDAKVRTLLYASLNRLLFFLVRADAYDQLMELNEKIDGSLKELREERQLLLNMKSAIKELEKYKIDDCNYDMALLLALINEKNAVLIKILNEEVYGLSIRIKGINYSSNSNMREDLQVINENIDYKVQRLSLDRRY